MKRTAEEAFDVPTLGQVAEADRFEPLRQLISSVTDTPVTELGEHTKAALRTSSRAESRLLLESLFDACDARAANVGLKRANVEKSSGENIKHQAV